MDTVILIALCGLVIIAIVLIIIFRNRKGGDVASLSRQLVSLQSGLKEDFRINREENAAIAKENRSELNSTLKEFKAEVGETLTLITNQSQAALTQINKTLEEKLLAVIAKLEDGNKVNRETLMSGLKDFSIEQRNKFEEIRLGQNELTNKTVEQLDKITSKVEEKLGSLTNQSKENDIQLRQTLVKGLKEVEENFTKNVDTFNNVQREKFSVLEEKQNKLIEGTEKKLEEMRVTVDEKLQKTLNERLGQSFDAVGKQLESVQKGLGEMQTLAQDVGGLKKVLSNVRMRGGFGEVQLSLLLEQILAPEQYESNVKTKSSSNDLVEFAIKFPAKDEENSILWLPIDAKFPKDVYENLQNAYDTGDALQIDAAQKGLEGTIRKMARSISEKYLDPPNTTDFAIMFLPFEGIYAEVVRKASLLEDLQKQYKVIVTGPTTLAAILNSLQMGFRTLVIQKRSSEVWKILGAVKKEFEKFGTLLDKAHKNINAASSQIEVVMGTRTKAIQRKLREIEVVTDEEVQFLLPDTSGSEPLDDDEEDDG